jgi:hypothetical protein
LVDWFRSPARDDKPDHDHEPDEREQYEGADDLIAGETHELFVRGFRFVCAKLSAWFSAIQDTETRRRTRGALDMIGGDAFLEFENGADA